MFVKLFKPPQESIAPQRENSRSSRSNSVLRRESMTRSDFVARILVDLQNKPRSNKGIANRNKKQLFWRKMLKKRDLSLLRQSIKDFNL